MKGRPHRRRHRRSDHRADAACAASTAKCSSRPYAATASSASGSDTLPHAIKELAGLGLLERLDAVAIRTHELFWLHDLLRPGDLVKPCAGRGRLRRRTPIDRGRLHGYSSGDACAHSLGESRINTGHRLGAYTQDEGGVTADSFYRTGHRATARGDVPSAASWTHSRVRDAVPRPRPREMERTTPWRVSLADWPAFLTGCSTTAAGGPRGEIRRADPSPKVRGDL